MSGRVSTRSTAGSAASSTARAISSPRSPPERTEEADMDDPKQKQTQRAAAVEAIRKRLQAYDRDGAIAAASGEISALIADHCQDIADAFLDPFLADPDVHARNIAKSPEAHARQRRDSADYVRQKYSRPLSTEWIDTALRNASRRHKAGVTMHAYLSALSAAHPRLSKVIRAPNPSVADACRLG